MSAMSDAPRSRVYEAAPEPKRAARTTRTAVRSEPNDAAATEYRAAVELVRSGNQADAIVALRSQAND
jgi:TolA-binding protein